MRISTTGMIEWLNQVNTDSGSAAEEIVASAINSPMNAVYAMFIPGYSNPN